MLQIRCPWCGLRDESEFEFGGEGFIERPNAPSAAKGDVWSNYLFNRSNPEGVHYETWQHRHGCRQWFNMARDTKTHEIHSCFTLDLSPSQLKRK